MKNVCDVIPYLFGLALLMIFFWVLDHWVWNKHTSNKLKTNFDVIQMNDAPHPNGIKVHFNNVTWQQALEALKNPKDPNDPKDSKDSFVQQFHQVMKSISYPNYVWESPRLTFHSIQTEPFEFVVIQVEPSDKKADPSSFRDHFSDHFSDDADFVVFPNLGRDALLVVPNETLVNKNNNQQDFLNLANFTQSQQILSSRLWSVIAKRLLLELNRDKQKSFWLSTSGFAVPWLHVRIGTKPKYYFYKKYTT